MTFSRKQQQRQTLFYMDAQNDHAVFLIKIINFVTTKELQNSLNVLNNCPSVQDEKSATEIQDMSLAWPAVVQLLVFIYSGIQ